MISISADIFQMRRNIVIHPMIKHAGRRNAPQVKRMDTARDIQ